MNDALIIRFGRIKINDHGMGQKINLHRLNPWDGTHSTRNMRLTCRTRHSCNMIFIFHTFSLGMGG